MQTVKLLGNKLKEKRLEHGKKKTIEKQIQETEYSRKGLSIETVDGAFKKL